MNKQSKYTSKNGYTGELIEQVDTFSEFYNMILGWLKNEQNGH